MSKSLVKSSSALAMANFGKRALLGITVLICARLVPKATFGNYMFLMTFYQIFAVIGGAGIPFTLVREVARDTIWRPERWSTTVAARSLYSVPAAAVMFAFFFLGRYSLNLLPDLGLLCAIILFRGATENAISIFQGREEAFSCALIAIVQSAVTLVSTLVVCLTSRGLLALVACHLIGAVSSTVFAFYLFRRRGLPVHFGMAGAYATVRSVMKESGWMNGATTLSMAYNRCDVLLLERLTTADAVAVYSAPYRILDITQIIPQGVMGILLSRISSHAAGKMPQMNQERIRALLLLGSLLMAVLAVPLAPILVPAVLGKSYGASVQVTEVLIWVAPLMSMNATMNTNLMAHRSEQFIFLSCLAALVFNFLSNLILIPHFGYMASAFITVGTEILLIVANLWSCRKAGIFVGIANGRHIFLTAVAGLAGAILWASVWHLHAAAAAMFIAAAALIALVGIHKTLKLPSLAVA